MRKFTSLLVLLFLGIVSFAQDTIRVSPDYINGGALNKAIKENGANKVYVLEANGFYTLTSTIEFLRDSLNPAYGYEIVGEIPTGDEYMPVLQTGLTADNTPFTNMFTVKANVTFKNIFIANQTTTGQIGDMAVLIRDKVRFEMDASVVDPVGRKDFINGGDFTTGSDIILTNNQFLRQGDPYSPGGGHMIRNVYADTMFIENNSFISTDHSILAGGDGEKMNKFFWFNHNTVVWHDVGLKWNYSEPNAYVSNNLFYDLTTYVQLHGWNGDPDKGNGTYANIMLIDTASVGGGLEPLPSSRTIKWDRNSLFVSDAVKDVLLGHAVNHPTDELWLYPVMWNEEVPHYFITDWDEKGQAILDASREAKMFDSEDFPNFVESNTWYDKNPNFVDSRIETHSVDVAKSALWWYYGAKLLDGTNSGTQKSQFWDVDGWAGTSDAMYPTVWPRWDGAYTNEALLDASTGGYPLGDLNAFPEEKAKWEAEKSAIMETILSLQTVDHILTAVNETKMDVEESFSMYPNPVSDVLTINSKSVIKSLKVYTITGQLMKVKVINDRMVNLDVSGLSKGIYVVEAEYKQGGKFTSKLVKE